MHTGYMVTAKDGKEYGPLDRDTIQRWYYEGRVDQNSRVCEPGKHEFRLKEVFDLAVWNNPGLIEQAAAASKSDAEFKPRTIAELAGEEGSEPTPGMFAAGVLLIINGAMGLLVIGLIMIGQLAGFTHPRGYIVPLIDMIVAVGLIRGKESFRKWGLVRAVLGGGAALLGMLGATLGTTSSSTALSEFSLATAWGWVEVVFQLVFCAGIAALLWGEWPSKLRVGIGVAAVLVAWSGIITASAVSGFVTRYNESSEVSKYSVPGSTFEDNTLGVSATLPDGWVLLTNENPIVPVPDAAMIAIHMDSGCCAAFLVEPLNIGVTSTDEYLNLVFENRKRATPSLQERGREDVVFGGHEGKRLATSWTTSGQKFRGFSTASRVANRYYLLAGWCLDGSFAKAFGAFRSLEKVFEVGPRAATEPTEITSESEEDFYDLVFFVQSHNSSSDGSQTILAQGRHDGVPVAFELTLGPKWKEGSLVPGTASYIGVASYRSVGAESDSFVQAIDEIYETTQSPARMNKEIRFSVVSLEGDPRNLTSGPVKLKLFFESSSEDRYAELFTNIDLEMKRVYLGEKDPDYRLPIVRALAAR